ncbi:hypothetical protein HK099_001491 [Clydaea vesicula]|uniref:Uncharacterized protein n=1 Tax=Clydaea vesicula TaxID=447962 RepID=A0AAD5Y180_9FUNG|nr:hypothetical protein HK099_001491 [Clydaea vesicula]
MVTLTLVQKPLLNFCIILRSRILGFSMVTMLAKGLPGVRKDEKKILELLNTLSLKNHGPSKYVLALKYLDNNIMDNKNIKTFSEDEKVKIEKGIALLEEAAALGYAQACAQLGHMYQKGIFVEENVNKAFHYLTLAAKDEDFSEAQFLLGNCYNYGAGAKKDLLKAHELYLKAATRGLSVAQHNVALSFEKGIKNPSFQEGGPEYLIEKEMWKAVEYYTLAAEQGFQLSCLNLGKHYLYGLKDGSIKQDVKLARKFFERCLAVDSEFKVQAELYLEDVKEVEKSQENSKFSREIKSGERFCVII